MFRFLNNFKTLNMKNLKINFRFFSLLALFTFTIFLISCEEEIVQQSEISDVNSYGENSSNINKDMPELLLPFGYNQLSQEDQDQYTNSLDEKTILKLIESAKIKNYFEILDKKDILLNNSKYGEIYDESKLSLYLSDDEVQGFQLFTDSNLENRFGCDCDSDYHKRFCNTGTFRVRGQITTCYYEKWVKECHAWYCPDRVQYRNYVCIPNTLPNCP